MASVVVVNGTNPDNGAGFATGQLSVSTSGIYRIVVRARNDTGLDEIYYSSDRGQTWTALTIPGAVAAPNGVVAVWDDGTIHYAVFTGGNTKYYQYTGSWSAGVNIWNQNGPIGIYSDGSMLVCFISIGSSARAWYSTDNGATWTISPNGPLTAISHGIYVGTHLYLLSGSGSIALDRWDSSANTWDTPLGSLTAGYYRIFTANGSTTEFFIAGLRKPASDWLLDLYRSTDSGATWSTIVTSETVPLANNMNGAISMGADGLLHIYGLNSGVFEAVTRSLVATPSYSATETVGGAPSGSGFVFNTGGMRSFPVQRYDGAHTLNDECYLDLEVTSGTAAPTEIAALLIASLANGWSVGHIRIG